MSNKEIIQKTKEILKELGHEVPIGHLYELFSKLSGHKNWNVANAKAAVFGNLIKPKALTVQLPDIESLKKYKVFVTQDATLEKFYGVSAKSPEEAQKIVEEFIRMQFGEENSTSNEQVKQLLKLETSEEFKSGWGISEYKENIKVATVYNA